MHVQEEFMALHMMECSSSKFPKQLSSLLGTGNDVVGIVIGIRSGQSRNYGSILGKIKKRVSSLQSVQTASGIHPASCSMGSGVLC
jgi:hypothetical protein